MLIEKREGSIVVLTLNHPERRNALAGPLRTALVEALERIEGDGSVRAVILTGAGGNFSAGGDLTGMNVNSITDARERLRLIDKIVPLIIGSSKPFVAAVEGWAVGAGLALACCCDTVVAAVDARMMAGFGKVGLVPDVGLLHTLPRRVGEGRARQIIFYCEPVSAEQAERIGLVDHVVPAGQALRAAMERAQALAALAPLPITLVKARLADGLAEALEWERTAQPALLMSADHAEGKAAFLEKRVARYKGC